MLLRFSPEIRCLIYNHIFQQPMSEILGLSREPPHNYDSGPPNDWVADSRQEGLVYSSDTDRAVPTNSRFLRTCRLINCEATPVFYGMNKIKLYAEDNNDIFYWLLDIGECQRQAIHHLEIDWAYGVSVESGKKNLHGLLQRIQDMEDMHEEESETHRQQLVHVVQGLEKKIVALIVRTLRLIATIHSLVDFTVYMPGVDGGDIWDLHNESLYFAQEVFSNLSTHVYACIPETLGKIRGLETLTIGYTKDNDLAETVARRIGVRDLFIKTCPERPSLILNPEERAKWSDSGWKLEGKVAHKILRT